MNKAKIDKLLKLVDSFSSRHHKHEILSDCFEIWAICISQLVDKPQYAEREQRYLDIVKKYDKHDLDIIAQMFGEVWMLLSNMPKDGFDDYLGQLYMLSGTGSDKAGQFFTPYSVSKMSAESTIPNTLSWLQEILTVGAFICATFNYPLQVSRRLSNSETL